MGDKNTPNCATEDEGMYFGWGIQWAGHELEAGESTMRWLHLFGEMEQRMEFKQIQ